MKPRLIIVAGFQRSGTTALFRGFADANPDISFNESPDSEVFKNKNIVRQNELLDVAKRLGGTLVTKPNKLFGMMSVEQALARYDRFEVRILWAFRNPADVYASHYLMRKQLADADALAEAVYEPEEISAWIRRNENVARAFEEGKARILLLNFEVLRKRGAVNKAIEAFAGLEYAPRIGDGVSHDRGSLLPVDVQTRIAAETSGTLRKLVALSERDAVGVSHGDHH